MAMLPEVGASELIVLAAVALIVVGPKDLPVLLKKVGQMVGRMRGLAADFRASFDDMARQSELADLRKEVDALRQGRLTDTLGPIPTFEELNHGLQASDSPSADPELVADAAAHAAHPEPSILPPPASAETPVAEPAPPPSPARKRKRAPRQETQA
jgi:sec-independent protein translocase protein TatB